MSSLSPEVSTPVQVMRSAANRMRARPLRDAHGDAGFALLAFAVVCWWGLHRPIFKDYHFEAQPAVNALLHGDLTAFLRLSPVYAGSMLLRAPFFLVGGLTGHAGAAYRCAAAACAGTLLWLALALARTLRLRAVSRQARWLAIGLCVANPVAARALQIGHPEDLLATAAMVAGITLCARGCGLRGGLLIGIAVASKQWAIIALPVAVAVTPRGCRTRTAAVAMASAGALLAPFLLASPSGFASSSRAVATSVGTLMNGENLWRLIGAWHWRSVVAHSLSIYAASPDYLPARWSHPMIVILPAILAVIWWRRSRRLRSEDILLLLAGCALLRCVLDPWNIVYYQLPFLIALLAWEVVGPGRLPVAALAATAAVWITFQTLGTSSADMPIHVTAATLLFAAWAIPGCLLMLGWSLDLLPVRLRRKEALSGLSAHVVAADI